MSKHERVQKKRAKRNWNGNAEADGVSSNKMLRFQIDRLVETYGHYPGISRDLKLCRLNLEDKRGDDHGP